MIPWHRLKRGAAWTLIALAVVSLVIGLFVVLPIQPPANQNITTGFTFSIAATQALGQDWHEVYHAALRDLHPRILRIPVYWETLEPAQGQFHWQEIDEQLALAKQADAKAILAIGHKLPRWPECHIPAWAQDLPDNKIEPAIEQMLTEVVNRYKSHSEVSSWQVENEALFYFGSCPSWSMDRDMLKREIELVKSLDSRPVMTTDSGELSLWLRTSTLPVDAIGVSLYRAVYKAGYHRWLINPYAYVLRRWFVRPFVSRLIISELQLEPWGPLPVQDLTEQDIEQSFQPSEFAQRFDYASRTGADTVIAWGVEWWYYMKQTRGDSRYWDAAKDYFSRP